MPQRRIVLVCGEASGDRLGAGLAAALREEAPDTELVGVGGMHMANAGVKRWRDKDVFEVMGYWDAIKRLPALLLARSAIAKRLAAEQPAVFVGIDAPDLNLPLGSAVHRNGGKYAQYVCPAFWAWRPSRARMLASSCNMVLALLPFEESSCRERKIPVEFVGHPAADELEPPQDRSQAKADLGFDPGKPLLALLPGSRGQEVDQHVPLFAAAACKVRESMPDCQLAVAVPQCLDVHARALWLERRGVPDARNMPDQARDLLAAADAAIVKSGTVALEAALLGCPQTVAYRMSTAAYWLALRRMGGKPPPRVALPNLVLGRDAVPEFVQQLATPAALAAVAVAQLSGCEGDRIARDYAQLREQLRRGANRAAAKAILALAP